MNISSRKLSGWLSLGALALALAWTAPLYAQQNNDQPQSDQINSSDSKGGAKTAEETKAAPAPPSVHNWRGAYVGAHVGYGWGKSNVFFNPLPSAATFINMAPRTFTLKPRGVNGGIQGGYNWQRGRFVFGPEADFSWSDMRQTFTANPIIQNNGTGFPGAGFQTGTHKTEWFGSLRWRGGVAYGHVLFYGTAGFAYAHIKYLTNVDFRPFGTTQYPAFNSRTQKGWTAGGGAEIAINQHWSVKAEYLYYEVGGASFIGNPTPALPPFQVGYDWTKTRVSTFNTGINFHF
jgi:outer membrane immunogenic protein